MRFRLRARRIFIFRKCFVFVPLLLVCLLINELQTRKLWIIIAWSLLRLCVFILFWKKHVYCSNLLGIHSGDSQLTFLSSHCEALKTVHHNGNCFFITILLNHCFWPCFYISHSLMIMQPQCFISLLGSTCAIWSHACLLSEDIWRISQVWLSVSVSLPITLYKTIRGKNSTHTSKTQCPRSGNTLPRTHTRTSHKLHKLSYGGLW